MSFAKREYEFLKEIGLGPRNSDSYTDGVWQGNGSVINSVNPADNQPIAEVVEASIQDYEEGMQACADATKIWMQVLKEFADTDEQEVRKSQYKEVLSDILLGMAAGLKRDPVFILRLDGHDLHDFINRPTFDPEMHSFHKSIYQMDHSKTTSSRPFINSQLIKECLLLLILGVGITTLRCASFLLKPQLL